MDITRILETFRHSADIDFNVNTAESTDSDALALIRNAASLVESDIGLSIDLEKGLLAYTGHHRGLDPDLFLIAREAVSSSTGSDGTPG